MVFWSKNFVHHFRSNDSKTPETFCQKADSLILLLFRSGRIFDFQGRRVPITLNDFSGVSQQKCTEKSFSAIGNRSVE